jgi:lipopolysaccharide/colanic/teichoic acid biosynthesis glycosyltransferase
MYRLFDFILSMLGLILLIPIFILLYLIGLFFVSKPIFLQQRVGRNRRPFTLVKFRTMPIGTASVASHELQPVALNGWFQFLRKYKLDELLQLFNVLWGDMGFVGPRPCLPNQLELVQPVPRAARNYGIGSITRCGHVHTPVVGGAGRGVVESIDAPIVHPNNSENLYREGIWGCGKILELKLRS